MRQQVGMVKEMWRYPVKGMAGESVEASDVSAAGIGGDRLWAVRDTQRKELQSCKFRPELLQCAAKYSDFPKSRAVEVRFPDGIRLKNTDHSIDQTLSALLGHASTLEALPSAPTSNFFKRFKPDADSWLNELKATFDREPGEPLPDLDGLPEVARDNVTLPGSFFLVAPIHIMTTASLKYLRERMPESDWDVRRFRPNLLIECEPGMEGLVEQAWVKQCLTISTIKINCTETAPRCGAVTRVQNGLPVDKSILRVIVKEADQNVGIYGQTEQSGWIKVGDPVYL